MKGLSVLFAIALLVLAHHLATRMKQAGKLPADTGARSEEMARYPVSGRTSFAL